MLAWALHCPREYKAGHEARPDSPPKPRPTPLVNSLLPLVTSPVPAPTRTLLALYSHTYTKMSLLTAQDLRALKRPAVQRIAKVCTLL